MYLVKDMITKLPVMNDAKQLLEATIWQKIGTATQYLKQNMKT